MNIVLNANVNKKKNIIAMIILAKTPAASIDICVMLSLFTICLSSCSTNAPSIGPKNAKPVDFILTLFALAKIPWANSWLTATITNAIKK